MLSYSVYSNKKSDKWVTFIHGAGGVVPFGFDRLESSKKSLMYFWLICEVMETAKIETILLQVKIILSRIFPTIFLEVLHHLNIEKSHFVGISLGTILIRDLAERNPEMVESMIMGGAILKLNTRSKFLMGFGNVFKSVVPYIFLYKLFAFIIMPKKTTRNRDYFLLMRQRNYTKRIFKVV